MYGQETRYDRKLATLSRTDKKFSPRAGLVWQPSDTVSYYVSYSKSFQPSGESFAPTSANAPYPASCNTTPAPAPVAPQEPAVRAPRPVAGAAANAATATAVVIIFKIISWLCARDSTGARHRSSTGIL